MPWWIYACVGCLFIVIVMIIRRIWPVIHGTAKAGDTRAQRMNRWNTYLVPMIKQHLKDRCFVGLAGTFTSVTEGEALTVGTWSLMPTLLPDVDYVALSQLMPESNSPEVIGFVEAESLRDFLGGSVLSQSQFGHQVWLYSWPEDGDPDAMSNIIVPATEFREMHGLPQLEIEETP